MQPGQEAVNRLKELLSAYGNASAAGVINKRRRWDFSGSFHFVGTIVSTIGEIILNHYSDVIRINPDIIHNIYTYVFTHIKFI